MFGCESNVSVVGGTRVGSAGATVGDAGDDPPPARAAAAAGARPMRVSFLREERRPRPPKVESPPEVRKVEEEAAEEEGVGREEASGMLRETGRLSFLSFLGFLSFLSSALGARARSSCLASFFSFSSSYTWPWRLKC